MRFADLSVGDDFTFVDCGPRPRVYFKTGSRDAAETHDSGSRPGFTTVEADRMVHRASRSTNNRRSNPALVVVGNPPKGKGIIISHNVQAVLYLRDDDGVPYVHAFGYGEHEEPPEPKERGDTLMLRGLRDNTGVEAILLPDGSILLRGPVR
jgi:hypothetical protein